MQNLAVNIASSKYMLDGVRLVEDEESGTSGVEEAVWGLYDLQNWTTSVYESYDGELQKSRGTLNIRIARSLNKYSQDHLWPSLIMVAISCGVFYFPFVNKFIVARLALSILALLAFTNLVVKSTKELPGAAEFNWNDLWNQQVQILMFIVIVVNLSTEVWFHKFENVTTAKRMNHEGKFIIPFLALVHLA